jgi:hypothetical protein
MMQEQAFRFGRARHLVGIAGLPAVAGDGVGVIVLNAGLVNRIGPFRLHVEMTRRLNARGYPTLRFDLSTLGDSGASQESRTRVEQVRADVDYAMSLLERQAGCSRFVLVGLCSGAQNAHSVACTEARVAGAVFLDGYAYRTVGYKLRHYLPRLVDPARWKRLLSRPPVRPAPRKCGWQPPSRNLTARSSLPRARTHRSCTAFPSQHPLRWSLRIDRCGSRLPSPFHRRLCPRRCPTRLKLTATQAGFLAPWKSFSGHNNSRSKLSPWPW